MVLAAVANLVTIEELERAGVVAEEGEGEGEGGVHGCIGPFRDTRGGGANSHDLDDAGFAGGFGLELIEKIGEKSSEASVGLARERPFMTNATAKRLILFGG